MRYLAPKLKHRIQIKQAQQGLGQSRYNREYETVITLWAFIEILNKTGTNFGTESIKYQNIGTEDTHKITLRTSGLLGLGKSFTSGFSIGVNTIKDENELKANYFIFHQRYSTIRGRLLKINRIMRDEQFNEFVTLRCGEVEEQGTGAFNE